MGTGHMNGNAARIRSAKSRPMATRLSVRACSATTYSAGKKKGSKLGGFPHKVSKAAVVDKKWRPGEVRKNHNSPTFGANHQREVKQKTSPGELKVNWATNLVTPERPISSGKLKRELTNHESKPCETKRSRISPLWHRREGGDLQ